MATDDPIKKPTPQQLEAANKVARGFAMRRHLVSGENTHVGNSLPKYVDTSGREVSPDRTPIPSQMIMKVPPSYVTKLDWDENANLPYFFDDKTGDIQYVNKEWFYTDRFNPDRGKSKEQLMGANLPIASNSPQIPRPGRL